MNTATNLPPSLILSYEEEGYENRLLSDKEAQRMLKSHGIGWRQDDDKLIASDEYSGDTTITTNWTLFDFLAYLNY